MDRLRMRLLVGAGPGRLDGLPGRVRRAVDLARRTGAPALPALEAARAAAADDRRRDRALAVATAQTRLVAGGLAALPFVAVPALDAALALGLLDFYLTPTGWGVGAAGLGLIAAGLVVAHRLVAGATRRRRRPGRPVLAAVVCGLPAGLLVGPVAGLAVGTGVWWLRGRRPGPVPAVPDADEVADLVSTALTAGLPPGGALRAVAGVLSVRRAVLRRAAVALERRQPPELPPGLDRIADLLLGSARWGAPAAGSLRHLAADLRAEELSRALAAAERLPALLAVPTAVFLLPASLLLVGAPLVATGVGAVLT